MEQGFKMSNAAYQCSPEHRSPLVAFTDVAGGPILQQLLHLYCVSILVGARCNDGMERYVACIHPMSPHPNLPTKQSSFVPLCMQ